MISGSGMGKGMDGRPGRCHRHHGEKRPMAYIDSATGASGSSAGWQAQQHRHANL